ncbi:MAG: tetratricopeptide repeat protein [Candidatus Heimdallarchaeaceae archaeon]|jgi:tetratricopeptide (TPR) repeat protein
MNDLESNAKFFFVKGKEDFLNGKYQECIRNLIYAQEMFTSMGNKEQSAESLFMIATAYTNINQLSQARQIYSQAFSRYKDLNKLDRIGECSYKLGEIYRTEGNFKKSKQYLAEAIEAFTKISNIEKLADTWKELGVAYQTSLDEGSANPNHSINAYKTAISYYKKLKVNNKLAETQYDLGQLLLSQSKFNDALKVLSEALNYYNKQKDDDNIITLFILIGRAYFNMGKKPKARDYMYKAVEYMRQAEYSPERIGEIKKSIFAMLG